VPCRFVFPLHYIDPTRIDETTRDFRYTEIEHCICLTSHPPIPSFDVDAFDHPDYIFELKHDRFAAASFAERSGA
jgi:hypothetical protein